MSRRKSEQAFSFSRENGLRRLTHIRLDLVIYSAPHPSGKCIGVSLSLPSIGIGTSSVSLGIGSESLARPSASVSEVRSRSPGFPLRGLGSACGWKSAMRGIANLALLSEPGSGFRVCSGGPTDLVVEPRRLLVPISPPSPDFITVGPQKLILPQVSSGKGPFPGGKLSPDTPRLEMFQCPSVANWPPKSLDIALLWQDWACLGDRFSSVQPQTLHTALCQMSEWPTTSTTAGPGGYFAKPCQDFGLFLECHLTLPRNLAHRPASK